MTKKRFNRQYSKPASTSHSSLVSTGLSTTSNRHQPQRTVNELIDSLRRSDLASIQASSAIINTPTLPPDIRRLIGQPEIQAPTPRSIDRWRLDDIGRIKPAGPAAPKSWVSGNSMRPEKLLDHGQKKRVILCDVYHLPGLPNVPRNSLREQCFKTMARNWNYIHVYEKHYLADLPTRLRMTLLSYLAVYGPETGVGYFGLKNIILSPNSKNGECTNRHSQNEDFFRLDLSGAMGTSLDFEQVIRLVRSRSFVTDIETSNLSWEEKFNLSTSLTPPLPNITHLSLSYPHQTVTWPAFLSLVTHLPTLTHLSLAHWPLPSVLPVNSMNMINGVQIEIDQINYRKYSTQNSDRYFSETTRILRKLATSLPGLEYLDLTGCQTWFEVLVGYDKENLYRGIEWGKHWTQLHTLKLQSGIQITKNSKEWEVRQHMYTYECALAVETRILSLMREAKSQGLRFAWIDFVKDL